MLNKDDLVFILPLIPLFIGFLIFLMITFHRYGSYASRKDIGYWFGKIWILVSGFYFLKYLGMSETMTSAYTKIGILLFICDTYWSFFQGKNKKTQKRYFRKNNNNYMVCHYALMKLSSGLFG